MTLSPTSHVDYSIMYLKKHNKDKLFPRSASTTDSATRRIRKRCGRIQDCVNQIRAFRRQSEIDGKPIVNLNSTYVLHSRFELADALKPGWADSCDKRGLISSAATAEAISIIMERGSEFQQMKIALGRCVRKICKSVEDAQRHIEKKKREWQHNGMLNGVKRRRKCTATGTGVMATGVVVDGPHLAASLSSTDSTPDDVRVDNKKNNTNKTKYTKQNKYQQRKEDLSESKGEYGEYDEEETVPRVRQHQLVWSVLTPIPLHPVVFGDCDFCGDDFKGGGTHQAICKRFKKKELKKLFVSQLYIPAEHLTGTKKGELAELFIDWLTHCPCRFARRAGPEVPLLEPLQMAAQQQR